MFNFLKKSLKSIVVNEQTVIEKIHNEFDSAGERLLKDAKDILAKKVDVDKGERLQKLGFTSAKDAVSVSVIMKEKEEKRVLAEQIEYFQVYYPNNKFITEKVVKEICEKYNLLFSEVNRYIGIVPDKNIAEIEAFKLRDEDHEERTNYMNYIDRVSMMAMLNSQRNMFTNYPTRNEDYRPEPPKKIIVRKVKPSLKICAPETDFQTYGMTKQGYKLIPDPIVLQPVKGGYLIVSKWGLEASDENVVNEKLN